MCFQLNDILLSTSMILQLTTLLCNEIDNIMRNDIFGAIDISTGRGRKNPDK